MAKASYPHPSPRGNTAARRYFRNRKLGQIGFALFWLSLPLSGLLQLDVAHLRLVLAGHPWPPQNANLLPAEALKRGAAAHWDIVAPLLLGTVLPVVLFVLAFLTVAYFFGRVHCGWSCTYGFLAETGEALFRWAKQPGPRRPLRLAAAWAVVMLAAPGVAFAILSLFVRPEGVWAGLAAHDPGVLVPYLFLTGLAIAAGGFVRLRFCRYVCGVGLVQTLAWMSNKKALEMGFHAKAAEPAAPLALPAHGSMRDCTGCHACKDVCPIEFDPRMPKRYMMACFQCGLCLMACEDELHPLGKGTAIGFHLYDPGYPLAAQEAKRPPARQEHVDLVSMAKGN